MKNTQILISLLTVFFISIGPMMTAQQNFERKNYIEINERAEFYHVDNRYNIITDTIYYCSPGFLVDPAPGMTRKGDKEYIILTYPEFTSSGDQLIIDRGLLELRTAEDVRSRAIYIPINRKNGRTLMIEKEVFEKLAKTTIFSTNWWKGANYKITTGLLTVPFKFRPAIRTSKDTTNFNLTTDVTLGPYFGITKRISKRNPFYVTIPATLGLPFININTNTTSPRIVGEEIGVVPGISWSSGIIFQFDKFNLGLVFGQDYASGIGDDWIYQGEFWYSFAIGYGFLAED